MFDDAYTALGLVLALLAPVAIVLFFVVLVIAYPWVLLVLGGMWWVVVKYRGDEEPGADEAAER